VDLGVILAREDRAVGHGQARLAARATRLTLPAAHDALAVNLARFP
jgi:hypothetical protein